MARKKTIPVTSVRNSRQAKVEIGRDLRVTHVDHNRLLTHLTDRLLIAQERRRQYIDIFHHVDKEYYCYLRRDAEDKKRQRDNVRGIGVKPTDEKLSMIFAQVDEAITYLLSVLAPDEAIYSAIAPKEKQHIANAFATLMNEHAERFGHYRNYALFLLSAMKYNFGGFGTFWRTVIGNQVQAQQVGPTKFTRGVVATGNEIIAFDPYNLLLDPSVNPVDMATAGEFFGYVDVQTEFRLRKQEADDELLRVDEFVKLNTQLNYYEEKPVVRTTYGASQITDWTAILSAGHHSEKTIRGHEIINMYAWIVPKEFGLTTDTDYQIWRFTLGSDKLIMWAEHMENAHAMLPCNIAMPWEDHFAWQTPSVVERLEPHQRFASFVMNTHQRATRKRLYGLTIFDPNVIPLLNQDDADLAGGKIATNPTAPDLDLRRKILQFNDGPDTSNTLENITAMNNLMQQVLPTNLQQQVAGLDRATQYQAAATVQSANRRNLKIAKVLNSQAMNTGRLQQYYNIVQFQQQIAILTPEGELQTVSPQELASANIQFTLSDGLKGLDKLALILNIKEVLNAILQSREAVAQIDVVAIINYWTSLLGDHTDFAQFRIKSPIDVLPVEQRNAAFQLLQQALQQQQAGGETGGGAGTIQ